MVRFEISEVRPGGFEPNVGGDWSRTPCGDGEGRILAISPAVPAHGRIQLHHQLPSGTHAIG